MVLAGKSNREIMLAMPDQFMRLHKGVAAGKMALSGSGPERPDFKAICLWGPPGTGKSTSALRIAKALSKKLNSTPFVKSQLGNWWDGYDGEKVAVLEEMGGSGQDSLSLRETLSILSPNPHRIQVKGTSAVMAATHFICTSNLHPKFWYKGLDYNMGQMSWRLWKIQRLTFFCLQTPNDLAEIKNNKEEGWNDVPDFVTRCHKENCPTCSDVPERIQFEGVRLDFDWNSANDLSDD